MSVKKVKLAWSDDKVLNAYHDLEYNKPIYDYNNRYIGIRGPYSARCTATSPGSVEIVCPDESRFWYSGSILKTQKGYMLLKKDKCIE